MTRFRIPFFIPWIFPKRVWKIKSNDRVYLTFDDGPQAGATQWILNFLNQEKIKATFFCVGENARKNPELLQSIINEGHSIGNHTMNHENGLKTSEKEYIKSITDAEKYIKSKLFRPPYGRLSVWKSKKIRINYQIIMWNWLSYDFDHRVSTSQIIKNSEKIKPGDILVFHDNIKSFERIQIILPQIIKNIKNRGLTFDVLE